jgi:hypothetical protein
VNAAGVMARRTIKPQRDFPDVVVIIVRLCRTPIIIVSLGNWSFAVTVYGDLRGFRPRA